MTAPEPPAPPKDGELIRIAREAMAISAETAAERTPIRIQGSRWRHIERGWERTKPTLKRVRAPARTLAQMARTVGVAPERLSDVGREDAAAILREILEQTAPTPAPAAEPEAPREFRRHYPSLSELVRTRRAALGLTVDEVVARCIDPESETTAPVWNAMRLEGLEAGVDATPPRFADLRALAVGLALPIARLQDAAGAQFYGLLTIWHPSGTKVARVPGASSLTPEQRQHIEGQIQKILDEWDE